MFKRNSESLYDPVKLCTKITVNKGVYIMCVYKI